VRGRRARPLEIAPADRAVLRRLARADSLPWYLVRRARIVLALADGEPSHGIAARMECDEATVWRTRRRYEEAGLDGLTAGPERPGRPPRISPPPAGPHRRPGLPGAGRRGPAHHPLVEP
jgi:hypothetical protein